jgi:hypothetical protein
MRTPTEIIEGLLEHAQDTEWVDTTDRCGDWIQECNWCNGERSKGHENGCTLVSLIEEAKAVLKEAAA